MSTRHQITSPYLPDRKTSVQTRGGNGRDVQGSRGQ